MSSSDEIQEKKEIILDEKEIQHIIDDNPLVDDSKPILHNGVPVITTGHDVSRFVIDIRDDQDPAFTFRSMFIGTMFAGMGAALSQVSDSKILDNDGNNALRFKLWYWPFLVDIPVQASADGSFQRLFDALDLHCWYWLGFILS